MLLILLAMVLSNSPGNACETKMPDRYEDLQKIVDYVSIVIEGDKKVDSHLEQSEVAPEPIDIKLD